jgi:hypothetical protein
MSFEIMWFPILLQQTKLSASNCCTPLWHDSSPLKFTALASHQLLSSAVETRITDFSGFI